MLDRKTYVVKERTGLMKLVDTSGGLLRTACMTISAAWSVSIVGKFR